MNHLEYLLQQRDIIWGKLIDSRVNEDLQREKILEENLNEIENIIQKEWIAYGKISQDNDRWC